MHYLELIDLNTRKTVYSTDFPNECERDIQNLVPEFSLQAINCCNGNEVIDLWRKASVECTKLTIPHHLKQETLKLLNDGVLCSEKHPQATWFLNQ